MEYHKIAKEEARWDRSDKRFESDFRRLYELGFRPVTLNAYIQDAMDLPPGASPIVFTFDDSHPSQFRLLPDGGIDPRCAVGIWAAFAKVHPDFPVRATFFVLHDAMWGQRDKLQTKLAMLQRWGCELGVHTWTHSSLRKLSDPQVEEEIAKSIDSITGYGFKPTAIALPYGISPKNSSLLHGFTRAGKSYSLRAALLVGAGPAPSPNSRRRDLYRLPRIQGIEGPYGITYWLDQVRAGKLKPYVAP